MATPHKTRTNKQQMRQRVLRQYMEALQAAPIEAFDFLAGLAVILSHQLEKQEDRTRVAERLRDAADVIEHEPPNA